MSKKDKNENPEKAIEGLGKLVGISAIFIALGIAVSFIVGFVRPVEVIIPKKSEGLYKVLCSLEFFFKYLPAIVMTGYVVSCAVYFGHNSEGSADRFSKAMFKRFKSVMISALICTAVVTFGNEIFGVLIKQNKTGIENRYKLINEYISVGNNLFKNGYYERAMYYADAVLRLDSESKEAAALKDNADVEINRVNNLNYRFRLYSSVDDQLKTLNKVSIDPEQIYDVYQCYLTAKTAYDNEQWFNAHYYAEKGLQLATPKDPNLRTLQSISTSAWNNLSQLHKVSKTQDQLDFERKYEGYLALVQKDELKAYYIFRDLYESSRELHLDPDVKFYLNVAETKIKEKYFFIDETIELDSYENSNDVYFALPYKDGSTDVVYFKGLKNVGQTGNSIQYVRDLTVCTIAKNGELYRKMTVPYAKILPVDVRNMNSTTKMLMGIDDSINSVPYIMLNSVARDTPNSEIRPVYTYANGDVENTPEYLLLPMPYNDFLLLETSSASPNFVPFLTLFKLVNKADDYGFSSEVYGQTLFDRMFYPIFVLIFFIAIAVIGWNCRIGNSQLFKMSWVISFPFIFLVAYTVFQLCLIGFQLLNYAILGACNGIGFAIIIASAVYVLLLMGFSIRFLSLRTKI